MISFNPANFGPDNGMPLQNNNLKQSVNTPQSELLFSGEVDIDNKPTVNPEKKTSADVPTVEGSSNKKGGFKNFFKKILGPVAGGIGFAVLTVLSIPAAIVVGGAVVTGSVLFGGDDADVFKETT